MGKLEREQKNGSGKGGGVKRQAFPSLFSSGYPVTSFTFAETLKRMRYNTIGTFVSL